jgi:hypothetical protein
MDPNLDYEVDSDDEWEEVLADTFIFIVFFFGVGRGTQDFFSCTGGPW